MSVCWQGNDQTGKNSRFMVARGEEESAGVCGVRGQGRDKEREREGGVGAYEVASFLVQD